MTFKAVLDACTLFPAHLRDTLLRLAERGLYAALWSDDILDELQRSLVRRGISEVSVEKLLAALQRAFPESEVRGYRPLIQSMTCDHKDRHVLAAAVSAGADVVVTFNTADFPASSVDAHEIEVIEPDEFLLYLLDVDATAVIDELRAQAAANRHAPQTLSELAGALARAGVPRFAAQAAWAGGVSS